VYYYILLRKRRRRRESILSHLKHPHRSLTHNSLSIALSLCSCEHFPSHTLFLPLSVLFQSSSGNLSLLPTPYSTPSRESPVNFQPFRSLSQCSLSQPAFRTFKSHPKLDYNIIYSNSLTPILEAVLSPSHLLFHLSHSVDTDLSSSLPPQPSQFPIPLLHGFMWQ